MDMNENNILNGEKLCKECGLCCERVFHNFAFIIDKNDCLIAQKASIPIEYNKYENIISFSLPCPVFDELCSIYPERPSVCIGHKCDLLKKVLYDKMVLEDALVIVIKMKNILHKLLPELQTLARNDKANNPSHLMNILLDSMEDEHSRIEFKKANKQLIMDFTVFRFLKKKYFYECTSHTISSKVSALEYVQNIMM